MVITVTLNPVLDRVIEIPNFRLGDVNEVVKERARIAGGKGINVSRLLKLFDVPTLAVGWLGGRTGKEIKKKLEKEEICHDFIWIKEESRSNLTIIDPEKGSETHLVEKGPRVDKEDIEKLKEKISQWAVKAKIIVFSGSAPPGTGENIYFELINLVKQVNSCVISVLDTRGAFLVEGIKACPYLIKPNIREFSEVRGKEFVSLEDVVKEVKRIVKEGVDVVVVSQGGGEVVTCVSPEEVFLFTPAQVNVINTVGAGDALVGGMVAGIYKGKDILEACILGVAAGSASAEKGREKPLNKTRITELVREIKVKKLT